MSKARDIASAAPAPSTVSATELGYVDGVTSAIQTQLDAKTAKSTLTTTGDIYYASAANTPARLGIGSTGNVLTVASGIPSWAAPAGGGGGMTFIQRSTFSNVADTGTTFDNVFTSTYETYFINIEQIYSGTAANDLYFQFRYAGPTTQTAAYYSINYFCTVGGTSMSFANSNNQAQMILSDNSGDSADWISAQLYVNSVGNGSRRALINGLLYNNNKISQEVFGGENFTAREYTGFLLKSSSANVSGTITIFGVNKS
jgi:hypothetical protein